MSPALFARMASRLNCVCLKEPPKDLAVPSPPPLDKLVPTGCYYAVVPLVRAFSYLFLRIPPLRRSEESLFVCVAAASALRRVIRIPHYRHVSSGAAHLSFHRLQLVRILRPTRQLPVGHSHRRSPGAGSWAASRALLAPSTCLLAATSGALVTGRRPATWGPAPRGRQPAGADADADVVRAAAAARVRKTFLWATSATRRRSQRRGLAHRRRRAGVTVTRREAPPSRRCRNPGRRSAHRRGGPQRQSEVPADSTRSIHGSSSTVLARSRLCSWHS